jgi:hypothetical protein
VAHYPILLTKRPDSGAFYCGVLLGFDAKENLFLGEWAAGDVYRPLTLQRGPFFTHGSDLAIDLDHPRVVADSGGGTAGAVRLFDDQSQPTSYLRSIVRAFQDLKAGAELTCHFIARLLQLKLIETIDIEVEFDDGAILRCVGLYTINQENLARLSDATVFELFRSGYLRLINLMIASLKHVPVMAHRRNARLLEATEGLAKAFTQA